MGAKGGKFSGWNIILFGYFKVWSIYSRILLLLRRQYHLYLEHNTWRSIKVSLHDEREVLAAMNEQRVNKEEGITSPPEEYFSPTLLDKQHFSNEWDKMEEAPSHVGDFYNSPFCRGVHIVYHYLGKWIMNFQKKKI